MSGEAILGRMLVVILFFGVAFFGVILFALLSRPKPSPDTDWSSSYPGGGDLTKEDGP